MAGNVTEADGFFAAAVAIAVAAARAATGCATGESAAAGARFGSCCPARECFFDRTRGYTDGRVDGSVGHGIRGGGEVAHLGEDTADVEDGATAGWGGGGRCENG